MEPVQFIAEVRKHQMLTGATDTEIRNAAGWSYSTMQRRFRHPESITLGEAYKIKSFLNM